MLEGPHRIRRGERVHGKDTLLAVSAGDTFEDIQDRLYASPRMLTRSRIAAVLYAGIGAGLLEVVPTARVDDAVDLVLERIGDGTLRWGMLAYHGQGLREWLGLPGGKWTDSAEEAMHRGRQLCAGQKPQPNPQEYDENLCALTQLWTRVKDLVHRAVRTYERGELGEEPASEAV